MEITNALSKDENDYSLAISFPLIHWFLIKYTTIVTYLNVSFDKTPQSKGILY
jgi:hypothetical protein